MPKVSVIIPTYNRAEFLRSAVESVLNQTFQDFEIIIVDDASTENIRDIVSAFCDERIKYIRHEVNKGSPAAKNTGVMSSNSDYIAFLDDDDEWLPEKLEMQVELMEMSPPTTGGVYTGFVRVERSTGKTTDQAIPEKRGDLFSELVVQNWIGTPSTVLLRKQCLERVGLFDPKVGSADDWDMWIRISAEYHFEYLKMPLVKYHWHDHQLSTDLGGVARSLESILDKYSEFFLLNGKSCSRKWFEIGKYYCLIGDEEKGKKAFLKAIKLYPFGIKHYVALCLCALGAGNVKKFVEVKEQFCSKIRGSHYFQSSGDEVYRR